MYPYSFIKPGRWNVTIHNTGVDTEYASVAVTSKPSTEEYKPVTVTVLLGSSVSLQGFVTDIFLQ